MGVYDPKNARLCDIYEGELLTQREPAADEADLQLFCETMHNIMKPGVDVCWIMGGRHESNTKIIKDAISKKGWKSKEFLMVHDYKGMQRHYWRRQRGLANSRTAEKLFICWRGQLPKNLPTERWYVDHGSPLYVEVMSKVPVVSPKDLAFVAKSVRETSLKRMIAAPVEVEQPATSEQPAGQPDDALAGPSGQELLQQVKRRRLYRQTTGTEVAWFPHDNPVQLVKELVWEAGGNLVKWVFYGTPAAGNGVLGALEMGCSAICLCEDAHHQEHFLKALTQKAVGNFLTGASKVFGDADLRARAAKCIAVPDGRKGKENKEKEDREKESKKGKNDTAKEKKEKKDKEEESAKEVECVSEATQGEDDGQPRKVKKKSKKQGKNVKKKSKAPKGKKSERPESEDEGEDTSSSESNS